MSREFYGVQGYTFYTVLKSLESLWSGLSTSTILNISKTEAQEMNAVIQPKSDV